MVIPPSRISIRMAEGPGSMLSPSPFPPHLHQPLTWPQPVLRSLFATCLYISKDNALLPGTRQAPWVQAQVSPGIAGREPRVTSEPLHWDP